MISAAPGFRRSDFALRLWYLYYLASEDNKGLSVFSKFSRSLPSLPLGVLLNSMQLSIALRTMSLCDEHSSKRNAHYNHLPIGNPPTITAFKSKD
jgi:hypothetical protein